ncbi:MAG: hypothetical protein R3B47_04890 [Bacteroidia bacterium]
MLTEYNDDWAGSGYDGSLFITRLHIRYDRKHFPQDLPVSEHPEHSKLSGTLCDASAGFYGPLLPGEFNLFKNLIQQRHTEVETYTELTGIVANDNTRAFIKEAEDAYASHELNKKKDKGSFFVAIPDGGGNHWLWLFILLLPLAYFLIKKNETAQPSR